MPNGNVCTPVQRVNTIQTIHNEEQAKTSRNCKLSCFSTLHICLSLTWAACLLIRVVLVTFLSLFFFFVVLIARANTHCGVCYVKCVIRIKMQFNLVCNVKWFYLFCLAMKARIKYHYR